MTFEDITVNVDQAVGVVSLSKPERGNAVRPQTLAELCAAFDQLNTDENVRAIILRGEGKHFCAGAHLSFLDDLTRMTPTEIQNQVYAHFQGAARRIYNSPKPTVALVGGAAVTVGCELVLACDFRLVTETAMFQESWIKFGIMPPLGGLFLLPRLVGLARAKNMVLRAEAVNGARAVEIGLATELVAKEQLDARGMEFALELARTAPLAYAAVKAGVHRGLETSMQVEWEANVAHQAVLLSSSDFREGLDAVKTKRQPSFRGR
jgi:enoyl-CoA hydratase/carnithine racemase